MKKRERLEVVYDILSSIRNKDNQIKPTHLLYKSNLSYKMMQDYLKELMDGKMVEENETKGKKHYSLTSKGFKFISEYEKIKEFSQSFGL